MEDRLSKKIYDSLLEDILSGEIGGQIFLSEALVAEKYGVSKAPVRDALHLLCSQGYLISFPRKGYTIKIHSDQDLREMQQVRLHLEKLSVELTIQNASGKDIDSLRQFIHTQRVEFETDPRKTWNTMFHMRLAEISGNKFLPEALQGLLHFVSRVHIRASTDFAEHELIVEALKNRNLPKAIEYLEKDLADAFK